MSTSGFLTFVLLLLPYTQGADQDGWTVVRPLSKSVFQMVSAEKAQIGDCFKFNGEVRGPNDAVKWNKYSTWLSSSDENLSTYKLTIQNERYCKAAMERLTSGSESLSITWTYVLNNPVAHKTQNTFPVNNCELEILKKETTEHVLFKAIVKSCAGSAIFWREIGKNGPDGWESAYNERKYYTFDVSTSPGTKTVTAQFNRKKMEEDGMSLSEFAFRLYVTSDHGDLIDNLLKIDLLKDY